MSIFKVTPFSQKEHNSNENFVMGAAHCAAPMTKISLLLWSFCAYDLSLKIDVCKNHLGHGHINVTSPKTNLLLLRFICGNNFSLNIDSFKF